MRVHFVCCIFFRSFFTERMKSSLLENQMWYGKYFQSNVREAIELEVLSAAVEGITVKKFTSSEFAEVACIVLRFALVMCQAGLALQRENAARFSAHAEFANLRFTFLNVKTLHLVNSNVCGRAFFTNVKYDVSKCS